MYKRIMLCYDGTLAQRAALREGAELAVNLQAEAHLLAIISPGSLTASVAALSGCSSTIQEEQYRREAEAIATKLRTQGIQAFTHLAFGPPIEQIPAFARKLSCDLVVVGYTPRGKLRRWWTDDVNVALAERTPCSILVAVERVV